jgi:hypothetical protein
VSNNVITNTGPASLVDATVGIVSTDGPIASESSLVIVGGLDVAADTMLALFDDEGSADFVAVAVETAPAAFEGSIFSIRVSVVAGVASGFEEVEVIVVGKEESIGEE